jgi:hypothetical protein
MSEPTTSPTSDDATHRSTARLNIHSPATSTNSVRPTTNVMPQRGMTSDQAARRLRAKLSDRDVAVLNTLSNLRLATGRQVQRLYVFDGVEGSRPRRCRALMKRLTELKLVVRLERRIGGIHAGSSGFLYGLSGQGYAVLASDGLYKGRRRREWEVGQRYQNHMLTVTELYVQLVEGSRRGAIELLNFQREPLCWRQLPGESGQTVTLKPDAFVELGLGEYEHATFVEVDLGTESLATLARKLAVYESYWRTGIEQARESIFPRVLWLTTTAHRADRIRAAIGRLPRDARELFRVDLLGDAVVLYTDELNPQRTQEADMND